MLTDPTKLPENLENLSIPELEALLFSDFVNTKDSPNTDFITKVMEVIVKKEQESACYEPINTDQAWSDFQEFYLENQLDRPSATVHIQKKTFRPIRRLIYIAAAVAVIIAMATIPVIGYRNVFHMIGTWTAEQFHFISIDETNTFTPSSDTQQNDTLNDNPILAFNEALTTYGVTKQLLPDELPTGFEQIEFEITEKPSGDIRLHACYKNGDDSIVLDANICSNNTSTAVFEKTDEAVELHSIGGLTYYIFSNTKHETAAVFYDNVEVSICTNLSRNTLLSLLYTINE